MGLKICYQCGDISDTRERMCTKCRGLYDGEYINTYCYREGWIKAYCNEKNIDKQHCNTAEVDNYIRECFFEKENDPDKYNEMLKRHRATKIQHAINYVKDVRVYNSDKYGNSEVCSQCGNVDNDSITGLCTKCGGELINTGKLPSEWVKIYYEKHPDVPVNIYDGNVNNFIREIFLEELPDPAFVARVKAQNEKKTSTTSNYKGEPCPKCHSTNTGYDRRGFSVGKAVAATALTGFVDVGAVAGAVGRNKPVHVCHNCGHKWK